MASSQESAGRMLMQAEAYIQRTNPDGMISGAVTVFHQIVGVTVGEIEDFVDGTPEAEAAMKEIAKIIRRQK